MRPVGRLVRLAAAGVLAAFALSGCGVPPSDVIQAGEPATGMPPGTTLYFLTATGQVVGVPPAAPTDLATAVTLLFQGPTPDEAAQLSTRLPRLSSPPRVVADGLGVFVFLPAGVGQLSGPAIEQVLCTAATAYRVQPPFAGGGLDGGLPTRTLPPLPPGSTRPATPAGVNVRVVGTGWAVAVAVADLSCPAG